MNAIMNLAAFLSPIGIFVYFGIIGYAALSLLRSERNLLQNLLLSPAIGIAFTLLPVFWLNRAGLPVKSFAIPLTFVLFFISIAIIFIRQPIIPFRQYRLFSILFFIALLLTGRPLLHFGFNWLSYANDDMANYCLGALRFLNHDYFYLPNLNEMIRGKDYSQYYWFTFIPGMVRSGSELLIAWLSGLTHINPTKVFMPLILGFHLILISTSCAMVLPSKKWKKIALITGLFITCSALTTLGTLYQLIAQVLGISLLIATAILCFDLFALTKKYSLFRYSILLAVTASALLIAYPEVAPMLGLSLIIYFVVSMFQGWRPSRGFTLILLLCFIESILFLNIYWVNIISFIQWQATLGLTGYQGEGNLFPYFIVPSGIANLWGLQAIADLPSEPRLSITILLGFCLSITTLLVIIKQLSKRNSAAIIAFAMLILGFYICLRFGQQSGFSLFKLAMYVQPFLLATLAAGIIGYVSSEKLQAILIVLVVSMGLSAQNHYLDASYGDLGKPFSELSNGSRTHLLSELSQLKKNLPKEAVIVTDTTSIISEKLQALYFSNNETQFFSNLFLKQLPFSGTKIFETSFPDLYQTACNLRTTLLNSHAKTPFVIREAKKQNIVNYFYKSDISIKNDTILIMDTPLRNIINTYHFSDTDNHNNYIVKSAHDIANHLVFINSSLGQYYYLGVSKYISLNALEKDYFNPTHSMTGVGRYLLFRIVNPTKQFRLVFNVTESLNGDGKNQLPPAHVIGDKNYVLPLVGRGSARVFSTEFTPSIIKNDPYVLLDMGIDGKAFSKTRTGLMNLFGNNVQFDSRLLTGFVRDISLVSEDEYNQIKAPYSISQFPADLNNKNLEYSGIYEDGWLSEDVYLKLSQPYQHPQLVIDGLLPALQNQRDSTVLTVYIDNHKIFEKQIKLGTFRLNIPTPRNGEKNVIRLHFSNYASLPKGDDRPISVKINSIGFETL